jgi:hypothetical protein
MGRYIYSTTRSVVRYGTHESLPKRDRLGTQKRNMVLNGGGCVKSEGLILKKTGKTGGVGSRLKPPLVVC